MSRLAVIWSGPASDTLDTIKLPAGTIRLKVPCKGSAGCRAELDQALALVAGLPTGTTLIAVGFSAGHGLNDEFLAKANPDAYVALDSYYAEGTPPSVLSYAQRAASGQRWMVTTTSDPAGATWRTCEQAIQPLLKQLSLGHVSMPAGIEKIVNASALGRGQYLHLPYAGRYVHEDHARVLGPIIIPWVAEKLAKGESGGWTAMIVTTLAFVSAVLLGLCVKWLPKRTSR